MGHLRFIPSLRVIPWIGALALGLAVAACQQVPSRATSAKPGGFETTAPPPAERNKAAVLPGFPDAAQRSGTAAVLVPLSGPQAALGTALLNAAQLALFELGDDSFVIQAFDTRGTPSGAQIAARQAIAQQANIIIGPLMSTEAKSLAPLARQANIPVIAFTTDPGAVGGGVYMVSFPPGQQATKMASYAASTGRTRLAALLPSTPYGQLIADTLQNRMPLNGPTLAQIQFYDPATVDWTSVANKLLASATESDPGFDAVLMADKGASLRELASILSFRGIGGANKVKILGTMLWQDEKLGLNPTLVNALYPAPSAAGHDDFDRRYSRAFGGKAPRLASLGYDATALAVVLSRNGQHGFSDAAISNSTGFMGVDGLFRLNADGSIERGYAIYETDASGNDREIVPAPSSFEPLF